MSIIGTENNNTLFGAAKDKAAAFIKKTFAQVKKICITVRNGFLSALFPENITCDLCGKELISATHYNLCADCYENMPFNDKKICERCGAPIKNEADFCLRCQNGKRVFDVCRAPLVYEGKARDLILALKYSNKSYIAKMLGAMMSDAFLTNKMSADIIVFVPMSHKEEKSRGYNQSELLAYEVGKRLNLIVLPALIKIKETSAQKGLSAEERGENLAGAFTCTAPQVRGLKILLIDDVFTTGSTANECAKILFKEKAREVSVLTAAITREKILLEGGQLG